MFQYRVTVNGNIGKVVDKYPSEQWARVAETCEERGYCAKLERRLITDTEILDLVVDNTGYMKLGNRVACPWEVIAEMIY
jgi:hypothetical protein